MNKHLPILPVYLLLLGAAFLLNAPVATADWVNFPPYDYFTANPSPIGITDPPSEADLHWLYKDVTSCTGTGFSTANSQSVTFLDASSPTAFSNGLEGWASVPISEPTTFTIACTGPSRTVSESVTVETDPLYFESYAASNSFTRFYAQSAALAVWSAEGTVPYGSTANLPVPKTCEELATESGLAADATYWCVEAIDYNEPYSGLCVYTCQSGDGSAAGTSNGSYTYRTAIYAQEPIAYSSLVTNPDGSVSQNPNPPPSGTTDACVGIKSYDPYKPDQWSCIASKHVPPVSPEQPNLTAGSVMPTTATAGETVTLSATVTNTGEGETGEGFTNLFQRATDASGTNATDIGTDSSPALAESGTDATQYDYSFPSAGTWYVRACADKSSSTSMGTVAESNEDDNCGPWTEVSVAPAFTLSCSVSPASITAGGSATWSASPAGLGTYTWMPSEGGNIAGGSSFMRSYSTSGTYGMSVSAGGQTVSCANPGVVSVGDSCTNPSVSLTASPDRVAPGGTTVLTVSGSGISGSCTVTGPGVSTTVNASSCTLSPTDIEPTGSITSQVTYTVTCDGATDFVIVNIVPKYEEF